MNPWSIHTMFPKYAPSRTRAPLLLIDPFKGVPGTNEGDGLGFGCTGGVPSQALTARRQQQFILRE